MPQAGITLVGFAGYLEGGDPLTPEGSWAAALGMLLVVLAEIVQAAQVRANCVELTVPLCPHQTTAPPHYPRLLRWLTTPPCSPNLQVVSEDFVMVGGWVGGWVGGSWGRLLQLTG